MSDERFTKLVTAHAINARDFISWGAETGHLDAEKFRWGIEARKKQSKKLTAPVSEGGSGLSHAKAAKILGVHKSTVQRDVVQKEPKSASKISAPNGHVEISVSPIAHVKTALQKGKGFIQAAQSLQNKGPAAVDMVTFSKLLENLKIQIHERTLLLDAMNEYVQRTEEYVRSD